MVKETMKLQMFLGNNKAALQMEMIDFQENIVSKPKYTKVSCQEFWIKFVCCNKYLEPKSLALKQCLDTVIFVKQRFPR